MRARLARVRAAARRLTIGDTARPTIAAGGVRAAIRAAQPAARRRRGDADLDALMPQSEGMTPLAPQFASGAAFTSQFEQLRGPGGQVLRPAEDRRRRSALAVGRRDVGTSGAAAADPRLAPLPADFDQVMQMHRRLRAGAGVSPEGRGGELSLRLRSPQRHRGVAVRGRR